MSLDTRVWLVRPSPAHCQSRLSPPDLLFFGSSCTYPKCCPQPIKEEYLHTSSFEHTNEAYAIAKVAGLKLCEGYNRQHATRYISVMSERQR